MADWLWLYRTICGVWSTGVIDVNEDRDGVRITAKLKVCAGNLRDMQTI